MTQALELDPHDLSVLQQISLTYQALGRYKEMVATLDRVMAIAPKDIPSRVRRALVDLENGADPNPFTRQLTQFWQRTRMPRLVLLIRGCWLSCANAIPWGPARVVKYG